MSVFLTTRKVREVPEAELQVLLGALSLARTVRGRQTLLGSELLPGLLTGCGPLGLKMAAATAAGLQPYSPALEATQ